MQAVRGSGVRMAALSCPCSSAALPASSGEGGSRAQTHSSGHRSTVIFRRILCSARCFCSAPSTELSHSRRKAGVWSGRSGTLQGKAVGAGRRGKALQNQCVERATPPHLLLPLCSAHRKLHGSGKTLPHPGCRHTHMPGAAGGEQAQGPQWCLPLKVRQKDADAHRASSNMEASEKPGS